MRRGGRGHAVAPRRRATVCPGCGRRGDRAAGRLGSLCRRAWALRPTWQERIRTGRQPDGRAEPKRPGAVAALVKAIRNPIKAARAVMDESPHVLLAGSRAPPVFALDQRHGAHRPDRGPGGLVHPRRSRARTTTPPGQGRSAGLSHGTVGCCVLDSSGPSRRREPPPAACSTRLPGPRRRHADPRRRGLGGRTGLRSPRARDRENISSARSPRRPRPFTGASRRANR